MSAEKKLFETPPSGDFPIGMVDGKIVTYTVEEARKLKMERDAYEALPDDETAEQYEETEKLDDAEIASIKAELDEE